MLLCYWYENSTYLTALTSFKQAERHHLSTSCAVGRAISHLKAYGAFEPSLSKILTNFSFFVILQLIAIAFNCGIFKM